MSWDANGLTIYLGENVFYLDLVIVIALLVGLAVVLLLAALILWLRDSRFRGSCRWKRIRERTRPPFTKWQCRDCGIEAYSSDKRPPKECKKLLKSGI